MKTYYNTTLGIIAITTEDDYVTNISFEKEFIETAETLTNRMAYQEISEYLEGSRKVFTLKYRLGGTAFQKRVWQELCNIPYGEVISYQELATRIGNEKASRAVGSANHRNPLPIIIPCHRVIGKNNKLVGYAGGIDIKAKLLEIEKSKNGKY